MKRPRVLARAGETVRSGASRHEYLAAAAFLLVVACLYFWPVLGGGQMGQSHLLYAAAPWQAERPPTLTVAPRSSEGDVAYEYQPLLGVARDQVRDGQMPIWNPSSAGGMPLLGDMQEAIFYPLTWLAFVLPLNWAWGLIAILKLLTAGFGTYLLARQVRVGPRGAIVAALVYMLAAPMIVPIQYPHGTVFSLLPWLILATDRVYRQPSLRRLALLAVVVGLQLLAGHPESALLCSAASLVYLLGVAIADRGSQRDWATRARIAGAWLGGHLLGVGIAAVAVLPFLQAYSVSISGSVHGLTRPTLPVSGLLLWTMPNIFGDAEPTIYFPALGFSYFSTAGYMSIAALLLGGVAILRYWRRPVVVGLVAVGVLAILTAFRVPPISWGLDALPVVSSANTSRVGAFIALAGAILAGLGLEALIRRPLPLRRGAIGVGAAAAVVICLYVVLNATGDLPAPAAVEREAVWRFVILLVLGAGCVLALGRLRPWTATVLVLALVVVDLAYLQTYNVILPSNEAHPPRPPSMAVLARQPRPFRIAAYRKGEVVPSTLPPNTAALYGLESVEGYDFPPAKRWSAFSSVALGFGGAPERQLAKDGLTGPRLRAYRMVNTRYYVAGPRAVKPVPAFRTVYRGSDATVFEDPEALPRAFVVGSATRLSDKHALEALFNGRLAPKREVAVPPDAPATSSRGSYRPATAQEVGPGHIRVRVPPGAAGWLVLANSWSPLWTATVDGHSRKVYPVNVASVGLPVSAGAHTVDFQVSDSDAVRGVVISLVSLVIAGVLWLLPWWRRRRARDQPA